MEHEFEAKSLKINKDEIRQKLKNLGATLAFPERLFTRINFKSAELTAKNSWIRIRDEGDKKTLSLKLFDTEKSIHGLKEISFEISDINAAVKFFEQLGYQKENFQQNYREEWKLDAVTFEIDTWPGIDPYLEIEAESEEIVKEYFIKLDLDYGKAMFGSTNVVYDQVYGIKINHLPELTFANPPTT